MKAKRFYWNLGFLLVAMVLFVIATIPGSDLSEIHNVNSAANFALVDARPQKDDWPNWRGIDSSNIAGSNQIASLWSLSESEGWNIPLQEQGNSTPIIWGNQLFLLASDPATQRIVLRSFHRETGRPNWNTVLHQGDSANPRDKGTNASSTPACDGQFVFTVSALQGALWMTSVDINGRIVWQHKAGPYQSSKGYSNAPAIYKNLVIVAVDQEQGGYLTAFHRQTGVIVWRVRRQPGESSGVPIVAKICGRPQLVLGGKRTVSSYDPATGDELWQFRWNADRVANSVAFDGDHVYATHKQFGGETVCIKADGNGNVTESHLVWRQAKIGTESTSSVRHGDYLYVLSEEGALSCLSASNGKVEWKKQLDGIFSASPIIVGDHLICCSQSGSTTIIQAGPEGAIVSVNTLAEGIVTSPIVAGQSMFVRTLASLRCITASDPDPVAERPEPGKQRL